MMKRILDLAIAVPALIVLSPVLALIALAIKLTSPGPVLFRQERIGLHNRPFLMLKFRSMVVNNDDTALREAFHEELAGVRKAEGESFKLANDPRVTRVGSMLRATSLDEITQLINVVQGNMSLVGPRPALAWEHEAFPAEFQRRTEVPPGITGMWQVNGRSKLSTLEMLGLDLEYVDQRSIGMDVGILFKTIPTLLRGDGAR